MTGETAVSALVLDTIPYRDKDFVVRLLTPEEGVFSAMAFGARGSRKRFPSGLDRLTLVDAVLSHRGRGMPICKMATTRSVFWQIRSDLDRSAVASVLSEVLLLVHLEPGESEPLFAFAKKSLTQLEQGAAPGSPAAALNLVLGVLRSLGFVPSTLACPDCLVGHIAQSYRLRTDSGALYCRDHDRPGPHRITLTPTDVRILGHCLEASDLAALGTISADGMPMSAWRLLEKLQPWLERTLGGRLKSFSFLLSLYAK
jgi:DNA repair protein RecO